MNPIPRSAPDLGKVSEAIAAHCDQPGALLPLLHAVQDALGYVPSEAVPLIARALDLSRAEVHGVISYYHFFRSEPPGRQVVQVCRAEACQACGAEALLAHAERVLGCARHNTRGDGAVTLEPVYCLGLCACAPAAMVNGRLVGRLDEAAVDRIAAEVLA